MTTVADLKGQTVAFAASGGLDSCTVTQWLTENGVTVVCFTADIAQPDETDFGEIEKRMRACGAADYVAIPLHDMIAASGIEVVQFQARYEGAYWNTTGMGVLPRDAPDKPGTVSVKFEAGVPVAINGQRTTPFQAIQTANAIGGRHGVGIATHLVENRFVGIKSRGVYEAPGMELLGSCYAYLLQLVLDRRARELFDQLSSFLARQVYQGYGYDLASRVAKEAVRQIAE